MVLHREAVHIQQTKDDAKDEWVQWHLCPKCEALETGQTEAKVMEDNFERPIEHKKLRVQRYQEALKKNTQEWQALGSTRKRKVFVRSRLKELFPKSKAPAMVAKDVEAHTPLVQKLKEPASLQEDEELKDGHGLASAKFFSANVVSANLVSFILFTNRGLSTNRCCVLKSAEEH